jgi:hypothetical protein
VIAPSNAAVKPGEGVVSLADLEVRIDPAAEWKQMYHEVWRIERAYFYDPNFMAWTRLQRSAGSNRTCRRSPHAVI